MFIRENLTSPLMDDIMVFISWLGNSGMIWIALGLIFVLNKKTRKWGIFMWLSMFLGLIFGNLIIKNLVARIRPCDFYNVAIIIPHPGEYSFPSGHTLAAFNASLSLYRCSKKHGIPALVFASLMAFSRLYLFVHYPTDILGGILLALVLVEAAYRIIKYFEAKKKSA